jgi:hypothetical protein
MRMAEPTPSPKVHRVRIEPDGTIRTVYDDDHPLRDLGFEKEVRKAGFIVWDWREDRWTVHHAEGSAKMIPDSFYHRREAVDAERKYLESTL